MLMALAVPMIAITAPAEDHAVADIADAGRLDSLVRELEALAPLDLERHEASIEPLLDLLAGAFRAATAAAGPAVDAAGLGARGCNALLRLPVTRYSQSLAAAIWEVARFNAGRRLNTGLVAEAARRLAGVGALLASAQWRARAYALSAGMHCIRADYAAAMAHAWMALTSARTDGEPGAVAAGWNGLGNALDGAGLHHEARRCFETALEEGRRSASEAGAVSRTAALSNLALSDLRLGDFGRGLRNAERASALLEGDRSCRPLAATLSTGRCLVRLLLESGRIDRARAVCDGLLRTVRGSLARAFVSDVETTDGLCLVFEGDVVAGLERVRSGLDSLRRRQGELRDGLLLAIRAHELAGDAAAVSMYRRELALHNRLVDQEGVLEQHRAHLRRLQSEQGRSRATLERRAYTVEQLAIATERREDPTGRRVFRIGRLSRLLAQEFGWSDADGEALEIAARLHDVGKISVADDIVTARRPLTAEEAQAMRAHCQAGAEFLRRMELDNAELAADVAAFHHEAWDGSGYPHGVGGTAIPLAARIVAIADAFDTMTGQRPYPPSIGVEDALRQLQADAGSRFDPALVPQFVALVRRLLGSIADLDAYLSQGADRSASG